MYSTDERKRSGPGGSQAGGKKLAVVCRSRETPNRGSVFRKTPGVLPGGAMPFFEGAEWIRHHSGYTAGKAEKTNMGKLIVIEGLDGSGKATQAGLLEKNLKEQGDPVRKVSFPDYSSESSALIKMYLAGQFGTHPDDVNAYAASSFFAVDRYASYKKDWQEDYRNGIIIADRYTTSNAIHQCAKLPREQWGLFVDWLFDYEYRLLGIPAPDLVIYLKVDLIVSQKLITERYHGHEEKKDIHEKDLAYLNRCQEAAAYCAQRCGWKTVECAAGDQMRPMEEIQAEILLLLNPSGIIER